MLAGDRFVCISKMIRPCSRRHYMSDELSDGARLDLPWISGPLRWEVYLNGRPHLIFPCPILVDLHFLLLAGLRLASAVHILYFNDSGDRR